MPVRPTLRAISFDYWDTLYDGGGEPERARMHQRALCKLLAAYGRELPEEEVVELYLASGMEAERWWREEHRGYAAADRIRWMLSRLAITRPSDCEHLAQACGAVDEALLALPPRLLPGAAETIRRLAARFTLAIISDTGFASGRAQDRLLEKDGLLPHFEARVYSAEVGYAKPRREPFAAALGVLGLRPEEVLHVGDIERTDVRGALDAGLRAVRLDLVRQSGPSAAELVARSYEELEEYVERQGPASSERGTGGDQRSGRGTVS